MSKKQFAELSVTRLIMDAVGITEDCFNLAYTDSGRPSTDLLINIRRENSFGNCRVLSLSDCRYSLNPLNQTRID